MTQRKKKVEEYEETIHNLIMETMYKNSLLQREQNAKSQVCTDIKMYPIRLWSINSI